MQTLGRSLRSGFSLPVMFQQPKLVFDELNEGGLSMSAFLSACSPEVILDPISFLI